MLARQEAIHLYRQAGYSVYFTNRRQLLFEIEGVSPRELEIFSRRSASIAQRVAQWKEEKRFPGVSEAVLKQMVALDTRDPKRGVTRDQVVFIERQGNSRAINEFVRVDGLCQKEFSTTVVG